MSSRLIRIATAAGVLAGIPRKLKGSTLMSQGRRSPDGNGRYDLVILGSGSTAFAAALKAQEMGKDPGDLSTLED